MRMVPDPNASVPARFPKAMLRTTRPRQYWVLVRLPVPDEEPPRRGPITLVAASTSLSFGGLLFDLGPWVAVGFSALFLSALLWFPLIRGITRSVSDMTAATDQIAQGRFEARARTQRRDELGALSQAINSMANRLGGFVYGQKRFLGDIAHELCSPLARMQMALGILEQRADDAQQPYVADVRDEVQHMSDLVNELLSFSKAGMQTRELKLQPVALAPLVRRVVEREGNQQATLDVQIDDPLEVLAEPDLLARAVANLVRNAVRYAGAAGPITISANPADERVVLVVADVGPGVPPDTLEQIFDPFYRVESSRSRETGGVGLGLAIVKTCVEACRGTVAAYNRSPTGLAVELCLVRPSGPPRPNAAERPALEDRPQEGGGRPQSSV
ncbi:MAG: HAMP domain-containing histidine kinase [Verrucomicrobia bacterium]|nr:HAMP domain-containing histidine kinase [Verrucomicrobiota bacterium]